MWEKYKTSMSSKDFLLKLIVVAILILIFFLSIDVMNTDRDGRSQIIDEDGGTEAALCTILKDIKGVGNVDILIKYDKEETVIGVIVTAEGAGNAVVKNNLITAVSGVFDIPQSNVMVYEKENGGMKNE